MSAVPAGPAPADWRAVLVAASGVWWVFVTVGIATVTLPVQIVDDLGYGETELGITVLAFGVATVVARIVAGPYLGGRSPWRANLAAAVLYAVSLAVSPLATGIGQLIAVRVVAGAAQGVLYLAAAAAISRAVPVARLGAALSCLSIALFAGIAVGPYLGNQLQSLGGIPLAWLSAAVLAVVVAVSVLPAALRDSPDGTVVRAGARPRWVQRWPPTAVWAAGIMALGTVGYGGFQALIPLVGPAAGVPETGLVFAVFAVVSIAVRGVLTMWIDRLDSYRLGAWSAALTCVGLAVLASGAAPWSIFFAAVAFAVSLGTQYPALMMLSLAGQPSYRRPAVIALYSASFDIGMGLGALVLGVITERAGFGPACAVATVLCGIGLGLHLVMLPRVRGDLPGDGLA